MRQEGLICQLLGKLICLLTIRAYRTDNTRHYEGKRLDSSGRNDGSEKISNSRKGKEKELIDTKRVLEGKVEGL